MGKFIENICPYITSLDLRGNEFGAVGLGEIGAGLQRAGLKLYDKPMYNELPLQKEVYTGTKWIRLQRIDLSQCLICE